MRTSSTSYCFLAGKNLAWSQVLGRPRKPGKYRTLPTRDSKAEARRLNALREGIARKQALLTAELLAVEGEPDPALLTAAEKEERAAEIRRLRGLQQGTEMALRNAEQKKFAWEARMAAQKRRRDAQRVEETAMEEERQRLVQKKEASEKAAVAARTLEKVCVICGTRYVRGSPVRGGLDVLCSPYCREVYIRREDAKRRA